MILRSPSNIPKTCALRAWQDKLDLTLCVARHFFLTRGRFALMELAPTRRALIVSIVLLAFFFSPLDYSILEPALPAIQRQYAVNEQNISWTYAIFTMAMMIGAPLIAKLSDGHGRRTAFGLTMTIFAAGTLTCALAPNYVLLLVGRTLQGFGAGGIAPIGAAAIGDRVARQWRGSVLSLMGVVVGIGLLSGPLVGDLARRVGWQTMFLVFALLIFLLGVLGYWFMLPVRQPRKPFDLRGLILLTLTVSVFIYTSLQIQVNHFFASLFSLNVLPLCLLTLALLFLLIWVETRAPDPLIAVHMFRERQVVLASSLALGYGFTRTSLAFLPALAARAFREPLQELVILLLPLALTITLGSLGAGALVDRIGTKIVVLLGLCSLTLGVLLCSFFPSNQSLFLLAESLCGLGSAVLVGAPVRYIFLNEFSIEERGAGQGLFAIMWTLGQQVSTLVLGALVAAQGNGLSGYTTAYLVIGVILVILTLAASGLKGRDQEQARAALGNRGKPTSPTSGPG